MGIFDFCKSKQPTSSNSIQPLRLLRISSGDVSTLGVLFWTAAKKPKFLCFTLEDEYRTVKVYGKTRIAAGIYSLSIQKEGRLHEVYSSKFYFHKGMITLQNVPEFTGVMVHVGNRDEDTAGCILVGDSSIQNITEEGIIGNSVAAYTRIYPLIYDYIVRNPDSKIEIIDYA